MYVYWYNQGLMLEPETKAETNALYEARVPELIELLKAGVHFECSPEYPMPPGPNRSRPRSRPEAAPANQP